MHLIIETIIGTFLGILAGGIITYKVSKHYYIKSSQELIKVSNVFATFLQSMRQSSENVEPRFDFDADGTPKGVIIRIEVPPATAKALMEPPFFKKVNK